MEVQICGSFDDHIFFLRVLIQQDRGLQDFTCAINDDGLTPAMGRFAAMRHRPVLGKKEGRP